MLGESMQNAILISVLNEKRALNAGDDNENDFARTVTSKWKLAWLYD